MTIKTTAYDFSKALEFALQWQALSYLTLTSTWRRKLGYLVCDFTAVSKERIQPRVSDTRSCALSFPPVWLPKLRDNTFRTLKDFVLSQLSAYQLMMFFLKESSLEVLFFDQRILHTILCHFEVRNVRKTSLLIRGYLFIASLQRWGGWWEDWTSRPECCVNTSTTCVWL